MKFSNQDLRWNRPVIPALVGLLLVGCQPEDTQPEKAAEGSTPQQVVVAEPQVAEQQRTSPPPVTPEPEAIAEPKPEPAPLPVLVKAGGSLQLPTTEEAATAERAKYAAPVDGATPLLKNLYGGAEVPLSDSLYKQLASTLVALREALSPMDYALLLGQVRRWEVSERREEEDIPNTAALKKRLEEIAKKPNDYTLFPRPKIIRDMTPGITFRPLVRHANGQMHFADNRVLVSLNHQNRYTASDIGEAEAIAPIVNHFWDTRTEELLLCSEHLAEILLPSRVDADTYVLWNLSGRGGVSLSGVDEYPYDSQMNLRTGEIVPISEAMWNAIPEEGSDEYDEKFHVEFEKKRENQMSEASAADGLGIRIQTQYDEGEGCHAPIHYRRITDSSGRGEELRYKTSWGSMKILNLRTLSLSDIPEETLLSHPLPEAVEQKLRAENPDSLDNEWERKKLGFTHYPSAGSGRDYSSNEGTLRASINWPQTFAAKVKMESGDFVSVELTEWYVGTGSEDTIAFAASAPNAYIGEYAAVAHGMSEYTGVWHKGTPWIFEAPKNAEREHSWYENKMTGLHRAPKGTGRLVPLEEVAKQSVRGEDILSWDDHELLVTEPGATDECTYLLIGGTKNVLRLRVNFSTREVEYLESWEVKGSELVTAWGENLRLLFVPASDNKYRMIRPLENGSSEEIGALYLTESDGYAVVLKDGRYAGSPGCEAFLNACDGRQLLNMRTLAPWRNRPAEVLAELGGNESDIEALRATTHRWLRRLGYDSDNMPEEPKLCDFPIAQVTLPELFTHEGTLNLHVKLRATANDICRLQVLRDGSEVPQPQITESDANGERDVTVQIPLSQGQNWIEVTPVDSAGVVGETTRFRIIRKGGYEPNLFVIAFGVADYDDDTLDLQYAAKDAKDMAKAWADCSGMQTRTLVLTDKEVGDVSVLEKVKNFLSIASQNDKIVFYIAGHGMLDNNLDYYFAPASFDVDRVKETGISSDAIMDCLDGAAAQVKLLLMDTCHAGELGEAGEEKMAMAMGQLPEGVRAIQHRGMKVKKTSMSVASKKRYIEEIFSKSNNRRGINMLAASAGAEYALETSEMQNGVYTASIIEALREPLWRDSNRDGILSIDELFDSVKEAVEKRTGGMQSPSISMLENRGFNDIVFSPAYYLGRGEWDRAISMLKNRVRLHDNGEVRRPLPNDDDSGWEYSERLKTISWLQKSLLRKPPIEKVDELLSAGMKSEFLVGICRGGEIEEIDGEDAYTICGYSREDSLRLLSVLMKHGADVNKLLFDYSLHRDKRAVEMLLQHNGDVNARDEQGKTPLMCVSSVEVANILLQNGADPNARDNDGKSVMDHHAQNKSVRDVIRPYVTDPDETAGLSAAQIRELGSDYDEGRNGKYKDEHRAFELYIMAADKGDMNAQRWVGWCYRYGRGVPKNEELGRKYLIMAAKQGCEVAAEELGMSVPVGGASSGDETHGLSAAQIRELGVDYAEARNGKPKNEQRAIGLYIKAADMGDMKAQRWMGWRYRQGRGVPKDESLARRYFILAAQQGDKAAADAVGGAAPSPSGSSSGDETAGLSAAQIRELGVDYAEARNGKSKNENRAIALYIKAADMGDMKAQRWMGWRYRQGRGVPKDESLARRYFILAAQQGDKAAADAVGVAAPGRSGSSSGDETAGLSAAQIRELGVDYAEARNGKPKNEQRAIDLYIKAADMGDIKAQRWMGWRFRQGRGVPKDEFRAKIYFNAAAQQGDEESAKAMGRPAGRR